MHVLGTAGHVDHGKTSLLRYITEMEPSRLEEERRRGMTIQLGFVWFETPDGEKVGVVDVPGHESFRTTMLVGASGIDAFIFIVACDDGWMAQSEEHLWALKNLGIKNGICVLTKTDLVDEKRVETLRDEIEVRLFDALEVEVPIFTFSAKTNKGGEEIKRALLDTVKELPETDEGRPYLFMDRVFSPEGQGVIVTGTLRGGELKEKQRVKVLPSGKKGSIRSLQSYGQKVKVAKPTSRVAVQLSDISKSEIEKGCQLDFDGQSSETKHFDLRFFTFPGSRMPTDSPEVLVIHGGVKTRGKFVQMGEGGGETSFVRIHLMKERWIRFKDAVMVLSSGGDRVIGGGVVVDDRSKRGVKRSVDRLEGVEELSLHEYLSLQLAKTPWVKASDVVRGTSFSKSDVMAVSEEWPDEFHLEKEWLCKSEQLEVWKNEVVESLKDFHEKSPEEEGLASSKLSKLLRVDEMVLTLVLKLVKAAGTIERKGSFIKLRGHTVKFIDKKAAEVVKKLEELVVTGRETAATLDELGIKSKTEKLVVDQFIQKKRIIRLSEKHILDRKFFDKVSNRVVEYLKEVKEAEVGQIRTFIGLGRKLTVLILETMDREGTTLLRNGKRTLIL